MSAANADLLAESNAQAPRRPPPPLSLSGESQVVHGDLTPKSMPDDISDASSSKGVIVENPDGSLSRALRMQLWHNEQNRLRDRLAEPEVDPALRRNQQQERLMRVINDDEVAMIAAGMQEYPDFVDEVITLYLKHEQIFIICLVVQAVLDIFFTILGVLYCEDTIREMGLIYKQLGRQHVTVIFWTFFSADLLFSVFYYPIGFHAVVNRSLMFFQWFTTLSVAGLFGQMLLAYINKFNLVIFFLRILSYIYARFLSSLIMSLLLLPR